jgi:Na+/H+-dicarboxylate symporter/ABC-type amino acid transport substrate-binding protein
MSAAATASDRKPRLGLSGQILIGLALGVAVGVFVGDLAAVLQPLADIYIRLVQMTVLPYLVITLVVSLGGLDAHRARQLALAGGALLLLFWALTLALIGLLPAALPRFDSGAFFSYALVEPRQALALIDTYVPANPFNALANAVVPAVVLFSCAVGVALIGVPRKRALLTALHTLEQAIVRVTQFVIRTTPLGVFAIAAVAAGTLDLDTLLRLQAYFLLFAVAALLLTFGVLPLVVTALTPLRYREVVGVAGDALLTAFVANSVFIVLPILVERMRALLHRRQIGSAATDATIEVLVPLGFVFPNAGKLLTLLFVPYAAWLAGEPLTAAAHAQLFGAGVFAYFAKAQVALPFLMDLVAVPHDYFQLYIPTTILTGKFDSMVSAAALVAFGLPGAAAAGGFLRLEPRRLLGTATAIVALTVASFFGVRALLATTLDTRDRGAEALVNMHAPRGALPVVVREAPPAPDTGEGTAFERIRARGTLRVGYVHDRPPFAFRNRAGALVGMDVELAGRLGRDLGVAQLEFVGGTWDEVVALLAEGRIDVLPSMPYLRGLLPAVQYSRPYADGFVAFAVADARRHEFATRRALRRAGPLILGLASDDAALREALREALPGVDIGFSFVATPRDFFEGRRPDLDALVMLAQEAAAMSLLYPQFAAVVPQPDPTAVPLGIAVRKGNRELAAFIDNWLEIQKASGALKRAYGYWVLGEGAAPRRQRWSVLHDVLGWQGGRGLADDDRDERKD